LRERRVDGGESTDEKELPMRRFLMSLMMLAFAGAVALPLAACNTVEGAGEDLSAGGRAISNTADKTKKEITN